MIVGVVGVGFLGLTAAIGFAQSGHEVIGIEADENRLRVLKSGQVPDVEPGLREYLTALSADGRLTFARSTRDIVRALDVAVITVSTPASHFAASDLRSVETALADILAMPHAPNLLIVKSTLSPGASRRLIQQFGLGATGRPQYVYNPDFLNQGTAIRDWHKPSRLIFGVNDPTPLTTLRALYQDVDSPSVITSLINAELIKLMSNAYLAMKVSFASEIANICDLFGGDIDGVLSGMWLDPRITSEFWKIGSGYSDLCLPIDLRNLTYASVERGYKPHLLAAVEETNLAQRFRPLQIALEELDGWPAPRIAVLGVHYEPYSADRVYQASRQLIPTLQGRASSVRVWDPALTPAQLLTLFPGVLATQDIQEAVDGANLVIVMTAFEQVVNLNWAALAPTLKDPRVVIDCNNCLDPSVVANAGLAYRGIGRPRREGRDG